MNIDRARMAAALLAAAGLTACATNPILEQPGDIGFGEANRQTMMAQVINPDPQYDEPIPVTSGEHAAQAIERYRNDAVKEPESIRTTSVGAENSSD